MHVAYYAPAWPAAGAANGITTYVSAMRQALLRGGHQVTVVSGGILYRGDDEAIDLHRPPAARSSLIERVRAYRDGRRGDLPLIGRQLARDMRAARQIAPFDLLEMEESFGWCRLVQHVLEAPVITRLHGPHVLAPRAAQGMARAWRSRQRVAAEGRCVQAAVALSSPTATTLAAVRSHYGRVCEPAVVIPNPGADNAAGHGWSSQSAERDTILFVGRFDWAKGADTLLAAFERVAARRPDARLTMIGPDNGMAAPDGAVLRFDDYAKRHLSPSVRERITCTGVLSPAAIAEHRRNAFVTVIASRSENFPYAATEAMAAGCPLVATACAGCAEVIVDGVTGWLTPIGSAAALAERIVWVLDHPEAAGAAGRAARERWLAQFAPEPVGRRMLAFYQDVVTSHAPQR